MPVAMDSKQRVADGLFKYKISWSFFIATALYRISTDGVKECCLTTDFVQYRRNTENCVDIL